MTSSITQRTAGLYSQSSSLAPRPWIEGKPAPHVCPQRHGMEWATKHMNPPGAHPIASCRRDSLARLRAQHARHQLPHALHGRGPTTAMAWPQAGWQATVQPAQAGGQTRCPFATDETTGLRRRHVTRPQVEASAAAKSAGEPPAAGAGSRLVGHKLVAFILLVLLLGVANRVLYRVALVPMANYVFFLAQFQNFGYLLVYFSTLGLRYRAGRVTKAMLAIDKRPLWAIGACEAVAQLLFMISASHLPGPLLPIINQSYLCWNLLFAAITLGSRYSKSQLGGAALIVLGVVLAAMPASATAGLRAAAAGAPVEPIYIATAVLCFAFPALASIIKDITFRKERERLGQPLDIFMVNSFGSLFQSVFVLLLLPINLAMVGVKLPELPGYLAEGARCFQGLTPSCGSDCTGAPMLVIAYVVANLAFNIAMLVLLRSVGAVSTTLVGSCLVPLTILAFLTLPLPLPPSTVGPNFAIGTAALCAGLLLFNWNLVVRPLLATLEGPSESVDLPAP